MSNEPWKFEANTFLTVTEGRIPLMGEILRDHAPKLERAADEKDTFTPVFIATQTQLTQWESIESAVTNAEAAIPAATAALVDKLESLTRKPDLDTNSPLETWDSTIRSIVAYQGTTYTYLLPHGRETLTAGKQDERVRALKDFATRLEEQTGKAGLIALSVTVLAFHAAAETLADTREEKQNILDDARDALEALRVEVAWQLFANTGIAMTVWNNPNDTFKIGELFDLALIRSEAPPLPAAPGLPTVDETARTATVAVMPENATRLELWREHPGGMPELLAIGEKDALTVTVPAGVTFDPGITYELWMRGRNSRGTGPESPRVGWDT